MDSRNASIGIRAHVGSRPAFPRALGVNWGESFWLPINADEGRYVKPESGAHASPAIREQMSEGALCAGLSSRASRMILCQVHASIPTFPDSLVQPSNHESA